MSIVARRGRGSGASASTAAPDAVAAAASRRSMGWADITIPRLVDTRACLRLRSDGRIRDGYGDTTAPATEPPPTAPHQPCRNPAVHLPDVPQAERLPGTPQVILGTTAKASRKLRPVKIPTEVRRHLGQPHGQSYSHHRLGSRSASTECSQPLCPARVTMQTTAGSCMGSKRAHRQKSKFAVITYALNRAQMWFGAVPERSTRDMPCSLPSQ